LLFARNGQAFLLVNPALFVGDGMKGDGMMELSGVWSLEQGGGGVEKRPVFLPPII
jgi:hypothetical protein